MSQYFCGSGETGETSARRYQENDDDMVLILNIMEYHHIVIPNLEHASKPEEGGHTLHVAKNTFSELSISRLLLPLL